jgi:hypothetical protein
MVHTAIIFLQGTKIFSWCEMHILNFDDSIHKEASIVIVVFIFILTGLNQQCIFVSR